MGAGDTFIAGMLYGLVCHADDWSVGQKVSFAVRLATLKVQREGFDGLGADVLGCVSGESYSPMPPGGSVGKYHGLGG